MIEQKGIANIGMTFQMSLDAFLEDTHPINKNKEQYEQALQILEETKKVRSWKRKQQIAQEALERCEDCIEAYMVLGTYEDEHHKQLQSFKEGMELATINLGNDFFLSEQTDFYLSDIAKPFFHIKFTYARALFENGYMRKAQIQFQEILNLNPSDHFKAHYYLYALALYFEEYENGKELLKKYDTCSAFDKYMRFLLNLKMENIAAAKKEIQNLKQANAHLFNALTYHRMLMVTQAQVILSGSEEEAAYIYHILNKAIYSMEYLPEFLMKYEKK